MLNCILKALWSAAAGLSLAACAISPRSIEDELRDLTRSDELHASYAKIVRREGALAIQSGTIIPGDVEIAESAARQECGGHAAQFASISISRLDGAGECAQEDRIWGSDLARVLSKSLVDIFGADAPVLSIRLLVAPDDAALDASIVDDVASDPVELLFGVTLRKFAPLAKRVSTGTIAHESHHAAAFVLSARRNAIPKLPRTNGERILSEGAAEVYGNCASLMVDNIASRAENNHMLNDRPGGVLTDAEIANLLKADGEFDEMRMSGVTASLLGKMLANSLWTSTIGADYFAAGDTDEGKKLLALCANGSLLSAESFRRLIEPFASDGVDAPAFPAWSDAIGESYFRRYDEAHARWRQKHGLP